MYAILIDRNAEKDLRKIRNPELAQLIKLIRELASSPRPVGCKKLRGTNKDWRIRTGDYRVFYEVDDRECLVKIIRVRHRREVYR